MPSDLTRAVRLYHTPDMMKQALKDSWVLNAHQSLSTHSSHEHSFQVTEEPDIVSDSRLARQRSAVARAILDEAATGTWAALEDVNILNVYDPFIHSWEHYFDRSQLLLARGDTVFTRVAAV